MEQTQKNLDNDSQKIDQQKIEIEELKDQIERSLAAAGGNIDHYTSEISLLKKQNHQFRAELEKNVAKIYKLQDSQRDLMYDFVLSCILLTFVLVIKMSTTSQLKAIWTW